MRLKGRPYLPMGGIPVLGSTGQKNFTDSERALSRCASLAPGDLVVDQTAIPWSTGRNKNHIRGGSRGRQHTTFLLYDDRGQLLDDINQVTRRAKYRLAGTLRSRHQPRVSSSLDRQADSKQGEGKHTWHIPNLFQRGWGETSVGDIDCRGPRAGEACNRWE